MCVCERERAHQDRETERQREISIYISVGQAALLRPCRGIAVLSCHSQLLRSARGRPGQRCSEPGRQWVGSLSLPRLPCNIGAGAERHGWPIPNCPSDHLMCNQDSANLIAWALPWNSPTNPDLRCPELYSHGSPVIFYWSLHLLRSHAFHYSYCMNINHV